MKKGWGNVTLSFLIIFSTRKVQFSTHFLKLELNFTAKMAVQALSTVAATSKSINQLNCRGPDSFLWTKNPLEPKNLQCQWLGTPNKFSLHSKNFKQFLSKQCTIRADVSFVLPRGSVFILAPYLSLHFFFPFLKCFYGPKWI